MVWRASEWEQGCAERWAWRLLLGGPEALRWWGCVGERRIGESRVRRDEG